MKKKWEFIVSELGVWSDEQVKSFLYFFIILRKDVLGRFSVTFLSIIESENIQILACKFLSIVI